LEDWAHKIIKDIILWPEFHLFHKALDLYAVCTYNPRMSFEWDGEKAASNLKKHRIDFADAVTVFDDLNAITIDDPDRDEPRLVTIGMDC